MAKQVTITVIGGTTVVKEVNNGKTITYASNTNRNFMPIAGGIKISASKEESILNNYTILIADLTNDGIDFTGVATEEQFLTKLAESSAFKYGGGLGEKSIQHEYETIAQLLADQEHQTAKAIQFVADASSDPTVEAGFAYYEYIGTILGTLDDYRKVTTPNLQDVTNAGAATDKVIELEGVKFNSLNNPITRTYVANVGWSGAITGDAQDGAFDSSGNLYLVEQNAGKVFKILPDGTVSTFATLPDTQSRTLIIRNDVLYITGASTNLYRIDMAGNVTILFTELPGQTYSSVIDSVGNIYLMPYWNNAESYKVDVNENITLHALDNTILGTSISTVIDSLGNIYYSSFVGNVTYYSINKISPLGVHSEFASLNIAADMSAAGYLSIDEFDNIYALEGYYNKKLKKITPAGVVTIIASFGNLGITHPTAIQYFNGMVYVAGKVNAEYKIFEITPAGVISNIYNGVGQTYVLAIGNDSIYMPNYTTKLVDKLNILYPESFPLTVDPSGNIIREVNIKVDNGVVSAPNATIENIVGNKDLVTKEFVEAAMTASDTAAATVSIPNITLLLANWALVAGFYEYDYANALILADTVVEIIPYNSTIEIVRQAEVLPMVTSGVGTVKIQAKYLPTANILIAINITK